MTSRTLTRVAAVAAALLSLAGVAGCEIWTARAPLPTPKPSTTASQPAETAQERIMRLDREAALKAYTTATAESNRLAMSGGASSPTKILTQNLAGHYLKFQMSDLNYLKSKGLRTDRKVRNSVVANMGWSSTEIGLTACEDASAVRLLDSSGKEVMKDRSRRFVQTLTVTKVDGRWKITDLDSKPVQTFRNENGCSDL